MGFFGKSKEEKLLDAVRSGDVVKARAALDGGANRNCKDEMVRWGGGLVLIWRPAPVVHTKTRVCPPCPCHRLRGAGGGRGVQRQVILPLVRRFSCLRLRCDAPLCALWGSLVAARCSAVASRGVCGGVPAPAVWGCAQRVAAAARAC
jgi:hypothetical protein